MTVKPKNSTIDGANVTDADWANYNHHFAVITTRENGTGYLRVPHRTDNTFHRVRCKKRGYKPVWRDNAWHWVKA